MKVPFVTSTPLDDLTCGLALLGLWWLLGLEQVIWLPIAALALAKLLGARHLNVGLPPIAWAAIAMVLSQILSLAFIVEPARFVTFARNLLAYLAATVWIVALTNAVRSMDDVRRVVGALAIAISSAGLVGLAGITGLWRPTMTSPVGLLLPEALRATTFGRQFTTRSTGDLAWFIGVGEYFRVESFFLFATFFSIGLIVCIPMLYWLSRTASTPASRVLARVQLALALLNLAFTTGRVAILSLTLGFGWFLLLRRSRMAVAVTALATVCIAAVALVPEVRSNASLLIQASAYARGEGSVQGRGAVYAATLEGIRERPLFGWGTERDVPGLKYPAGSHSNYLGTLYKHGFVGFLALCAFFIIAWRSTRNGRGHDPVATLFLQCAQWVLVALVLNGLTDVLDLDIIGLVMAWTVIGLSTSLTLFRGRAECA